MSQKNLTNVVIFIEIAKVGGCENSEKRTGVVKKERDKP